MPEHTIAENLTRLQNAKTAIGNAITAKGGTVAASDGLEEFAADIATIVTTTGGHEVTVTTIADAEVTLSKTGTTYTATADNNGVATFTGVTAGTYTVTATYDGATSDSTTITITDFSATENTFATISITASDDCTITITDGTITKTVSYLAGATITQYASVGSTWDISATIDDTLITRTVAVTTYTDYAVNLAPTPPVTIVSRTVDFQNFTSYTTLDVSGSSVYTNMKRCNVADDGTINAFDGDTGYTESGSNGQVMVYVPKFWYKLDVSESGSLDGNNIRKGTWSIADAPADGYKLHPAFINASGNEVDYFLYGAFDAVGQDSNGTYSTSYNTTSYKLGSVGGNSYKPSVSLTRATARTMATNRGTGWYSAGVKQTMAIQMLFAVEYGFNSQTTLGNGIVSASAASNTGTTTGSTSSGDLISGKTTAVNYRGIENFWGNVWNWIDGINFYERTPYICNSYSFADDISSGYTSISFNLPSSNYITALGYDSTNDWILLPSESSSTSAVSDPIGDYVYSGFSWRVARLGGSWRNGSNAGAFCWLGSSDSSSSGSDVGSRVMFIP